MLWFDFGCLSLSQIRLSHDSILWAQKEGARKLREEEDEEEEEEEEMREKQILCAAGIFSLASQAPWHRSDFQKMQSTDR